VILAVIIAVVYWNASYAAMMSGRQRLRICVVAARRLGKREVVKDGDVVVRVRPSGADEYFKDTKQLIGRQLSQPIEHGDMITEAALEPISVRNQPVTFFISVEADLAGCIATNAKVSLIQIGKETKLITVPTFRVVGVQRAETSAAAKKPMIRMQLMAERGEDAMRVLSAGELAKFVPLVLDGSMKPCAEDTGRRKVPKKQKKL
jgi:hypothetical protein